MEDQYKEALLANILSARPDWSADKYYHIDMVRLHVSNEEEAAEASFYSFLESLPDIGHSPERIVFWFTNNGAQMLRKIIINPNGADHKSWIGTGANEWEPYT